MAAISAEIIRGGSSTEYLGNVFRDASFLWSSTETGRYEEIPGNERICLFCNSNKSEDENHFLLDCSACSKIRDVFFSKLELKLPNLQSLSHDTLIGHLMKSMNSSDYLTVN